MVPFVRAGLQVVLLPLSARKVRGLEAGGSLVAKSRDRAARLAQSNPVQMPASPTANQANDQAAK